MVRKVAKLGRHLAHGQASGASETPKTPRMSKTPIISRISKVPGVSRTPKTPRVSKTSKTSSTSGAHKRGDTLVEVMLAVGIFSMVAVAVVAVMSGGTSSSQTALETTLAREEIDAQAEAIRFIQRAYVTDVRTGYNTNIYSDLWENITEGSLVTDPSIVANFNPNTCQEIYNGAGRVNDPYGGGSAFIIDTTQLANGMVNDAIKRDVLYQASTYPHLIFNSTLDVDKPLIDSSTTAIGGDALTRAEGIYVITVKDPGTNIAGATGGAKQSAYYDFYIRTCWYGTGDKSPSTISTVIRLYNPAIVKETV